MAGASNTPKETPREKFVRLAESRTTKAIAAITLVGNLAGAGYDYTDEDAEKIVKALADRVNAVSERFASKGAGATDSFKL